jgi:Ca2+/Na+ antiporter
MARSGRIAGGAVGNGTGGLLNNFHFGIGTGVICKSDDNSWYCSFVKMVNTILMVLLLFYIFYIIFYIVIPFFYSNKKSIKFSRG